MAHKILIVEDDIAFGTILENWFKKNHYQVFLRSRIESAKAELLKESFDLVLTDLRLPDGDGILLLGWIKEQKKPLPVIIMTSYGEIQSAVSAIKLGAFDFLEKPINHTVLKQKVEQALAKNTYPVPAFRKKEKQALDIVYGKSPLITQMYKHIELVAPTRMSVLITGESGTGKEYAARLIHEHSNRKSTLFIAVDCGVLSKELAQSELFGHLKGSFTSAIADKKGVFEEADGGTVLLDEIGNLSLEVQMQLLRALQEHKIRPVGSTVDIKVDVRIIAATNENLGKAIAKGRFREDLYHRLNEFTIEVPPLRERREDIAFFANQFMKEANIELDKNIKKIDKETIEILEKHSWSGNLRELKNVIRRAALFTETDKISPKDLPILISTLTKTIEESALTLTPENERKQIEIALAKANGNKTMAARFLKIDRKTLYNKMHQYNMEI